MLDDAPTFADYVAHGVTRFTPQGNPYVERAFSEHMHYTDLENREGFAKVCDGLRLKLRDCIRAGEPGPVNHVRVMAVHGSVNAEGEVMITVRARCRHEPEASEC